LGFGAGYGDAGNGANTPAQSADRLSDDASPILPVFMIEVGGKAIAKGAKIPGVVKVIEQHDGTLADLATRVAVPFTMAIEIQGSSSASRPKQSYDIELVDDRGRDRNVPLLGLPPGSDWVLHGCGFDKTCLRNVLAYHVGREFGRYAPRTRFLELFIDGTYRGLYVLVEKIRRDNDRVDLPRPAADPTTGDISGGYIFRLDPSQGTPDDPIPRDWVSTVSPMVYSYHYPRFDEITAAQKAYLHDHMASVETLMKGNSWNDPQTGYRAWLDVPSWVDFALIQELANNVDAYWKSVYVQKWPRSRGNRVALGPIWDFDFAFGAATFRDGDHTDAWAHAMNRFGSEYVPYDVPGRVPYVPAYWERLWTDPAFHTDLKCRWRQLRAGPLRLARLHADIDAWAARLSLAQPRDGAVWKNPEKDGYAAEIASLKGWLDKRLPWMDANLPGTCV
jgi:hypothetical protein